MKKLVAFTTIILILLVGVLGFFVFKGDSLDFLMPSNSSSSTSILTDDMLETSEENSASETAAEAVEATYDDNLLKISNTASVVTYTGKDFEVKFANPFCSDTTVDSICAVFYDAEHGYLLKSIGSGSTSAFYEAYRTSDGCDSWTKCAADLWLNLDGDNYLSMISETELVYVSVGKNVISGADETKISYSSDFGETWIEYADKSGNNAEDDALVTAVQNMTRMEKVCQMLIISPEELTGYELATSAGTTTYEKLSKYPVGGLIYSSDNIESSYQFESMLSTTQSYYSELYAEKFDYPLFLVTAAGNDSHYSALDGNTAVDSTASSLPGASDIGDTTEAKSIGSQLGDVLSSFGSNISFNPIANVQTENSKDASLYFGSNAQTVSDYSKAMREGLNGKGVLSVMKYFPSDLDTSSTLEELKSNEMLPFINAISAGVDAIMVGNVKVPEITGDDTPASLSDKVIKDVLRGDLGYDGVVMTASLRSSTITDKYSNAEAAVMAVQAGADIIVTPKDFHDAKNAILDAIESGELSEARINQSVYRILKLKSKLKDDVMTESESETESDSESEENSTY